MTTPSPAVSRSGRVRIGMGIAVAVVTTAGYALASLSARGDVRGALGWHISPGWWLLPATLAAAGWQAYRRRCLSLLFVAGPLVVATLIEFAGLQRPACSYAGLLLGTLGTCLAYAATTHERAVRLLYMAAATYIDGVHFYDLLPGFHMMYFFKPGWVG